MCSEFKGCPMTSIGLFISSIISMTIYKKYIKQNKQITAPSSSSRKKERKEEEREEEGSFIEPLQLPIINLDLINLRDEQSEIFQNECYRIAQGYSLFLSSHSFDLSSLDFVRSFLLIF